MAWRVPPIWNVFEKNEVVPTPENSKVLANQRQLVKAAQTAISAVFDDVQNGLSETVGVDCALNIDERCSVILDLSAETDVKQIAQAIDMENVEAWLDENNRVHLGISPWLSTKDVDQTVLSTIKVIHVLLGIHASDTEKPKTLKEKFLSSVVEIMNLQKNTPNKS